MPRLLSKTSALLLLPLYTRVLTPDEMGTAMVVLAIGGILGLLIAPGIETAYLRWAHHPSGSPDVHARRAGTVAAIHLALLTVTLVLLAALAHPMTAFLLPGIPAWPFYYLVLATAALSSLAAPLQTSWRADGRPDKLAVFEVAHSAIAVVTILTSLLILDMGALSLLVGDLVARMMLLPWYVRRLLQDLAHGWDGRLAKQVTPIALVGLPLALSAWALSSLDRIFLNRFVGAAEVGVYSVGYQIGAVVVMISIILNREWQPLMFGLTHRVPAEGSEILQRLWTESLCVFLALGSVIVVSSGAMVRLGLGDEYQRSAAVVPAVVMIAVLRIPRALMTNVSLAVGLTRDLAVEGGLAVAVFVAASVVLIPRFGAVGTAWAGVLAYATGTAFLFFRQWNPFRIDGRVANWALVLGGSVVYAALSGDGLAAGMAALVLGPLFILETRTYWRFLGSLPSTRNGRVMATSPS